MFSKHRVIIIRQDNSWDERRKGSLEDPVNYIYHTMFRELNTFIFYNLFHYLDIYNLVEKNIGCCHSLKP